MRRRGPARPSLDYYELYDLVALQFAHVRMVGQIAWTGVALAELGRGEGDPDVTVDTQLVTEPSPPEAFIALGSQEDVALAEYALVQVPPPPLADVEATIAYTSNRADLAAAQLRAGLLETQVEELRAKRNHEAVSHSDAVELGRGRAGPAAGASARRGARDRREHAGGACAGGGTSARRGACAHP